MPIQIDTASNTLMKVRDELSAAHHMPGRLRLRFSMRAASLLTRDEAAQLGNEIQRLVGIKSVRLNAMARSLVIEYDVARIPSRLWRDLVEGSPGEAAAALRQLAAA